MEIFSRYVLVFSQQEGMFRLDKIPHSQIIHSKIALIGLTLISFLKGSNSAIEIN